MRRSVTTLVSLPRPPHPSKMGRSTQSFRGGRGGRGGFGELPPKSVGTADTSDTSDTSLERRAARSSCRAELPPTPAPTSAATAGKAAGVVPSAAAAFERRALARAGYSAASSPDIIRRARAGSACASSNAARAFAMPAVVSMLMTTALLQSRTVLCISDRENTCGEVNGNVRGWEGGQPSFVGSVNWKALPSHPRS